MKQRRTYIKNIILPCFVFSFITGVFTGLLIFLFKLAASFVLSSSAYIYELVRERPMWLPLLVLGGGLLGLISALILRFSKNCRGGGIPTSVAILRGLIDFNWLKSVFLLFASALVSFFGGVPLGNEGPSVQMGTAVGRGTIRLFAKRHKAWDRYIMTGGACGGFAVATGAPLTGIFFAFEEAHRRFSPMLFMTAAMTVTSATATMRLLCGASGISPYMFDFLKLEALPIAYLWIAVLIGIVCGILAVAFTKLYALTNKFLNKTLSRIPFTVKVVIIFALVALCGFASEGLIGTGHDVIHSLVKGEGVWYLMIIYFCVRSIFLMLANNAGISGGIFVPTLTFGALIGAFISNISVKVGILPEEYFVIPIVIGMASFLAASSRTPITAITFALEALAGLSNILPIAIGVTLSFLVIETWGVKSLHDMVIEQKLESFNKGKESTVVDGFVTVMRGAFAVGKETRDILWPPTCTVLSVRKPEGTVSSQSSSAISVGDVLHIHYQTYDPSTTLEAIEAIVGEQAEKTAAKTHTVDEKNHIVPEL